MYNIYSCNEKATPWYVVVNIDNTPVRMQVNTGASLSIMTETISKECFPDLVPAPSQVKLCSYTGESISVIGSFNVNVVYKSQSIQLPLVIVKGSGPTLMGHNWLEVYD